MAQSRKTTKAARGRRAAAQPEAEAPRAVSAHREAPRIELGDERGRSQLRSIRAPQGAWVMVRIAMGTYGDPANGGHKMERERVFQLQGKPGDTKMVRLGYLVPVEDNGVNPRDCFPCRACGALFATLNALNGHGGREHRDLDTKPTVTLPPKKRGDNVIEEADLQEAAFLQQAGAQEDQREQQADERMMRETPPFFENTEASAGA